MMVDYMFIVHLHEYAVCLSKYTVHVCVCTVCMFVLAIL